MKIIRKGYTKDGRKVFVHDQINASTWVVQEIYVKDDGTEFPNGERFTVDEILDAPALSWKEKNALDNEIHIEKQKVQIAALDQKITELRKARNGAAIIDGILEQYEGIDVSAFQTIVDFMTGKITHYVTSGWSGEYRIYDFQDGILDRDRDKVTGTKMLTLFGTYNGSIHNKPRDVTDLTWKINHYRDGSGGYFDIIPFHSYEEAIAYIESVYETIEITTYVMQTKEKYNLRNPNQDRVRLFRQDERRRLTERIAENGKAKQKLIDELHALDKELNGDDDCK